MYLPPDAQDRLFDDITALSAPGSQLATEYHPDAGASIGERARALRDAVGRRTGSTSTSPTCSTPGERSSVVDYLRDTAGRCQRQDPARDVPPTTARDFPDTDELAPVRDSLAVIAKRK